MMIINHDSACTEYKKMVVMVAIGTSEFKYV